MQTLGGEKRVSLKSLSEFSGQIFTPHDLVLLICFVFQNHLASVDLTQVNSKL